MKFIVKALAATALMAWGAVRLPAQDAPQAGAGADEVSSQYVSYVGDPQGPTSVTGDSRPLTGGQSVGIGSWGSQHSFFIPQFAAAETLDSNPLLTEHGAWRGFTSLGTAVQLIQYFGPDTQLRYAGAVRFDTRAVVDGQRQFTNAHGISLSKRHQFGSLGVLLDDEAQYSNGSNFGASGMEGLGPVITQVSQWGGTTDIQLETASIQPGILPNQSILTNLSGRISNTVLGEGDYRLDGRTTLSATGYYGLLHFTSPGLIDTTENGLLAGYNRALSPRDTLAIEYGRSNFEYSGSGFNLANQYGGVLYGRRISGRLAVVAGAGPEYTDEEQSGGDTRSLNWQGQGRIDYQLRAFDLNILAIRSVTGGGGVLFGARTSMLEGRVNHALARRWGSSLSFGVAKNSAIVTTQNYNTQYAGLSISTQPDRRTSFFLSYDLQHQTATGTGECAAGDCAATGLRQVFGVGIRWNHGPVGIQ